MWIVNTKLPLLILFDHYFFLCLPQKLIPRDMAELSFYVGVIGNLIIFFARDLNHNKESYYTFITICISKLL